MSGRREADTRRRLARLNVVILAAFGLIAVAAAYWSVVRGPTILTRSDNPRLVEAELKVRRGAILDVNSRTLAASIDYNGVLRREYPLPQAAPAVGYYSLRYGTAGIEEAYDAYLRGELDDFWSNLWQVGILGQPQGGRDLRLTIDWRWQDLADSLLGDESGGVLLFSLPDVAIRAMASSPGYDPNTLDADFEKLMADEEAPLLNRVTQGQYQPGLLLQPFLMAIAAKDGLIDLGETAVGVDQEVIVEGVRLVCEETQGEAELTWAGVLEAQCPGPMLVLGQRLGADGLRTALGSFGLSGEPGLLTMPADVQAPVVENVGLAAIGQDVMAIRPLDVGVALAALANEGQLRPAQLVAASQDELGEWESIRPAEPQGPVVPVQIAQDILAAFKQRDGILERSVMVLSGPEGGLNSWYLGLAPAAEPRYGVVVVVENDQGASSAAAVGRSLLESVLDPGQA
ncbi:MAG: penicillin-binding transpeptidase domain-containing protein [Chloroflexota bacterium]